MKIKSLTLRNYKRFVQSQTIFFTDTQDGTGSVNDITLIIGENGSGKSSVLQAIAMLIGGASRPNFTPANLEFPGFQYEHIQTGITPVQVEGKICFSEEEISATREFAQKLQDMHPERAYLMPAQDSEILLRLDYQANKVLSIYPDRFYQAKGYEYALQLRKFTPDPNALLNRVGTIHWYTEQRNLNSIFQIRNGDNKSPISMKNMLISWARFHQDLDSERIELREGQSDKYANLERLYANLFRGRSFFGPAPKDSPDDEEIEDFFLYDGRNQYELGSMSGAERAWMPILVDFANWNINNSIILIDEIELHLHPPLQQEIVQMLPTLGRNNQFIITTHSRSVAALFPQNKTIVFE